ncbi:MAG: phosphoribosylamine--glycine ligase [Actinobacteria bacterium]|nr:phosphoribosylamine--glycine ligase [Actinomycetota bacterium]MCL5967275.1 phosphoribosylamine--glycine ligase [Bacillota bacterium]
MSSKQTVLIIGSGAREHAIAWMLKKSPEVGTVYMAPGHGGLGEIAVPVSLSTPAHIIAFAEKTGALVVIGPEQPLADGLGDALCARGLKVVGPSAAAARVESSKAEAKALMTRLQIPTARFEVVESLAQALEKLDAFPDGVVVKADGLAQGKGVVVAERWDAARVVEAMMTGHRFGTAGDRVVLEERLTGVEMSYMVLTDGVRQVALPTSRDYKRLLDGDRGPNTGGMGAIAPHPDATPALLDQIADTIVAPLLWALAEEGRPFRGILYAGLMLTDRGPYVLEWNARLGDPEAGVVLPLLGDDLFPYFEGLASGELPNAPLGAQGSAVGVVMATPGYPYESQKGIPVTLPPNPEAIIFQAGTEVRDGALRNTGGRTLLVVGQGGSMTAAREQAYRAVSRIAFPGAQIRGDIGY